MCGIAGIVDHHNTSGISLEEALRILRPLRFRGPDSEGQVEDRQGESYAWLGHTRLSIIDLSDLANQPMQSSSKNSFIIFNGEIYNYKALREELLQEGVHFRTQSDTEVIVNGYERWGIKKTLEKLDGMFAFAIYDLRTRQLFLARDRFGKKPLYYYRKGFKLMFSSDIRSFYSTNASFSLDLHALGYFFTELSTPHFNTIWNEIKKLQPGSFLRFDSDGNFTTMTFWNLNYSEDCHLNSAEIVERTENLLSAAVQKRLVADVRVGALLSGGIDSSLVVAKMAEASSSRIKTYSIGFHEHEFNELPYAKHVAERFDTDHTEIMVDPSAFEKVDELIDEFGEPFADSSMVPTYLICKQISKHDKVVLGGDGGDEIFAGYFSYYFAKKFDRVKNFPAFYSGVNYLNKFMDVYQLKLLKVLVDQIKLPRYTLLNRNLGFNDEELRTLFDNETFANALNREHQTIWKRFSPGSPHDLINVLAASLKTRLLNDYLVKVDRASMYASLEMRSPFLDKDLAAFAATLTSRQLMNRLGPKAVLKEIAAKYFSHEFINRNKMGFSVPLSQWFNRSFSQRLKDVILGGKQKKVDFNYQFIERLIADHDKGSSANAHKIWALYVFHIWAQKQ